MRRNCYAFVSLKPRGWWFWLCGTTRAHTKVMPPNYFSIWSWGWACVLAWGRTICCGVWYCRGWRVGAMRNDNLIICTFHVVRTRLWLEDIMWKSIYLINSPKFDCLETCGSGAHSLAKICHVTEYGDTCLRHTPQKDKSQAKITWVYVSVLKGLNNAFILTVKRSHSASSRLPELSVLHSSLGNRSARPERGKKIRHS